MRLGPAGLAGAAVAGLLGGAPWQAWELALQGPAHGAAWGVGEALQVVQTLPPPPAWLSAEEPWSWRSWLWGVACGAAIWPLADLLRLVRLLWLRGVFQAEALLRSARA